jgi:hypothetical protein
MSGLGIGHDKMGNRGQIFENLQANGGPVGQEFTGIEPIYLVAADSLLSPTGSNIALLVPTTGQTQTI